jgi:hypothetical protein
MVDALLQLHTPINPHLVIDYGGHIDPHSDIVCEDPGYPHHPVDIISLTKQCPIMSTWEELCLRRHWLENIDYKKYGCPPSSDCTEFDT